MDCKVRTTPPGQAISPSGRRDFRINRKGTHMSYATSTATRYVTPLASTLIQSFVEALLRSKPMRLYIASVKDRHPAIE
jgi:hypothetical protein